MFLAIPDADKPNRSANFPQSTSRAASFESVSSSYSFTEVRSRMRADRPKVLCVGEVLFDAIQMLDARGRSIGVPRMVAGGAPANTAVALRKLGVRSAFVGCIAQDAAGDSLLDLLDAAEVDVRGVQRTREAPTRIVRVACDARGERRFLDFGGAPADAFADAHLQAEALSPDLLRDVGFVVVGSLSQAYPQSRKAIARILYDARKQAIPILLDVNRRHIFWPEADAHKEYETTRALVALVAYLKATDEEARWLFHTSRPDEIAQVAPQLRAGIVVTDGPREIRYCVNGVPGTLLPPKVASVDTTGAGDAFTAGWIARLTSGDDAPDAYVVEVMRYACAVGALATAGVGAWSALPTHAQVQTFLAEHGSLPTNPG
jgi:fructokinase